VLFTIFRFLSNVLIIFNLIQFCACFAKLTILFNVLFTNGTRLYQLHTLYPNFILIRCRFTFRFHSAIVPPPQPPLSSWVLFRRGPGFGKIPKTLPLFYWYCSETRSPSKRHPVFFDIYIFFWLPHWLNQGRGIPKIINLFYMITTKNWVKKFWNTFPLCR